MKRAALIAAVSLLAIDQADACHHFRIWKYLRPQTCRATALAPESIRLRRTRIEVEPPAPPRRAEPDMPLPSLTDIEWGMFPNDDQRGRLLLRVLMEGKEKHE